jgi:excinuclease UvrABC ATPase subunit
MIMATRTDTRSPALHAADSHDLIRVHGARVNNLKDVSVELPKRRLTVFTGVSGSGKSSLVFGTIAAESRRRHRLPLIATARLHKRSIPVAGISDEKGIRAPRSHRPEG